MTYDRIILICTVLIAIIYLWASQQIPTLEITVPAGEPGATLKIDGAEVAIAELGQPVAVE